MQPTHFYKYYSCDSLKATLRNTTIKWSSPLLFNDPFDNQIVINWTDTPESVQEKMSSWLIELANNESASLDYVNVTLARVIRLLRELPLHERKDKFYEIFDIGSPLYTKESLDNILLSLNDEIKRQLALSMIFCVTEAIDNLLMWAHYADCHRGGVVKFLALEEEDSPLLVAQQVKYCQKIPSYDTASFIIEQSPNNFISAMKDITLIKGDSWAYEKEWRVILPVKEPKPLFRLIPFAEKEVGGLFLGCRMTEDDKAELCEIMRNKYPWAPIYQSEPQRESFALKFTELSL